MTVQRPAAAWRLVESDSEAHWHLKWLAFGDNSLISDSLTVILWRCQRGHNLHLFSITQSLGCAWFFIALALIHILLTDKKRQTVDLRVCQGKTNLVSQCAGKCRILVILVVKSACSGGLYKKKNKTTKPKQLPKCR